MGNLSKEELRAIIDNMSEAEFKKINALPSDQRKKEIDRVVDNSINFLENFL